MAHNIHLALLGLLIFAMASQSSASFCVCRPNLSPAAYQSAIDYSCGAGADCGPIKPNGQCYNPNSIQAHCSYATNSYFQKNAGKGATCDFHGAATLTDSDPSGGGCSYSAASGSPSTGKGTGTTSPVTTVPTTSPTTPSSTPVTPISGGAGYPVTPVSGGAGTPSYSTGTGTGTGTGTNPTTTSPYSTGNPTSTGVLGGGVGPGMAPTGSSMDDNHSIKLESKSLWSVLVALVIAGIVSV